MQNTIFAHSLAAVMRPFRAVCIVLCSGMRVLLVESLWFSGHDFVYWQRLRRMYRQRDRMNDSVARMATLADPKREQAATDLALLESDIAKIENERSQRHRAILQNVRSHIPADFFPEQTQSIQSVSDREQKN